MVGEGQRRTLPGMTRTPAEALQALRDAAADGRLDAFCAEHGIELLTAFGSALRDDAEPRDLDLAVRLADDVALVPVVSALVEWLACDQLDVLDLRRAGVVARANALDQCEPLYELRRGDYARASMAALAMAAETAWIRDLQLDRLAG